MLFRSLYSSDLRQIRLAPAYDLVCTRAYPGTRELSFFIGGELDIEAVGREHFEEASTQIALNSRLAMRHFDDMRNRYEDAVVEAYEELTGLGFSNLEFIKNAMLRWRRYEA